MKDLDKILLQKCLYTRGQRSIFVIKYEYLIFVTFGAGAGGPGKKKPAGQEWPPGWWNLLLIKA
jgi:hypothetical protein